MELWLEKLKALKTLSGMTTHEIALASGLAEGTLEKIFSGRTKNPGVNSIQQILHIMGYTLDDIDPNKPNRPAFSGEAMQLARDFDALDDHGRRTVRVVTDSELARVRAAEPEKKLG